jgi:hypothetical protein
MRDTHACIPIISHRARLAYLLCELTNGRCVRQQGRTTCPALGGDPGGSAVGVGWGLRENALVWLWGLHADHEQVHEHRGFRDCRRDDDEGPDLLAEIGDQEQREQVHDVAGGPHDEQDAEPFGDQP